MASTISTYGIAQQLRTPELMPPWMAACIHPLRSPRLPREDGDKAWPDVDRSCDDSGAIGLSSSGDPIAGKCPLRRCELGSQGLRLQRLR
jgi:hypothetical protein